MRAVLVALLVVCLSVPMVSAQDQDAYTITIHAKESGCPAGKTFCFSMDGDLTGLTTGDEVTITLVNDGTTEHELVIVPLGSADPDHKATAEDDSPGEIPETGAGQQATATFQTPKGGFYFFCAISGHEQLGMWLEAPAAAGENDSESSPGPSVLSVLVLAVAAVAVRRRR